MNSYVDFARIYDKLMHKDINYERIADYIENIFTLYGISPDLVCDLACGTGNVTIPLAKRGYDMTAIDISEDMLNIARSKSEGLDILYLNQNIASLDLYGTMGAFTCMIDGINYILSPKALLNMFTRIKKCFSDPGALFIFDISTRHKLKHTIGSSTLVYPGRNIFYTWQNRYIRGKNISDMFLTFFVRSGKNYRRFEERHLQHAYSVSELRNLLGRAGFSNIDTYKAFTFEKPVETDDRIVFVCS